jgi:hypothetical protein
MVALARAACSVKNETGGGKTTGHTQEGNGSLLSRAAVSIMCAFCSMVTDLIVRLDLAIKWGVNNSTEFF